ncbi:TIGR03089 family protein [Actinomyces israelii]|uniref:TIGR03089 family protein n=1 Tax=Actinomyces israelii TaxID=1659 RepID=A0ABT4I914_9ACTO|nr:TIGR03089 family protein [Actinomyces israelii]MCZ0858220.1 TIGR03089 family protein [Actinomyces israelii]
MTDALIRVLPSTSDSSRPWLVWYAPGERIELTGHVLSMWHAKCAGFVTAEAGPGADVHLGMSPHWRAVTWCAGAWVAGATPVLLESNDIFVENLLSEAPVMSVAFRIRWLFPSADVQVLVTMGSLATRWPGALPPLVLDGIADVMPFADRFPAAPTGGSEPALRVVGDGGARTVSRDALAEGRPGAGAEAALAAGARALLIRQETTERAVLGVLAAWRAGLTAVLVSPDADAALLAAAARQEGAVGAGSGA